MDLATVARVKTFLAIESDEHDELLKRLVEAVSAEAAREMDRETKVQSRTEYFDVERLQQHFVLRAYPVVSVSEVAYDADGIFTSPTLFTQGADWQLLRGGVSGELRFLVPFPYAAPGALRVTYLAGMASATDTFMATYPDIAHAVIQQVAFLHQTRHQIGQESVGAQGTSVSTHLPGGLLPAVRNTLSRHRRVTV